MSSAPGIFQNVMDQILQGIPGVICYLDDILISTTPSEHEHIERLSEVLGRLEKFGVSLVLGSNHRNVNFENLCILKF